jgi:hypothetical protein
MNESKTVDRELLPICLSSISEIRVQELNVRRVNRYLAINSSSGSIQSTSYPRTFQWRVQHYSSCVSEAVRSA